MELYIHYFFVTKYSQLNTMNIESIFNNFAFIERGEYNGECENGISRRI